MADPHKPFWQNVQGEPSRKLFVAEGHFLFLPAFAVILVGKTDLLIGHFFDAVVADGNLMRVTPQILNHLFWATKRTLAIHDPVF